MRIMLPGLSIHIYHNHNGAIMKTYNTVQDILDDLLANPDVVKAEEWKPDADPAPTVLGLRKRHIRYVIRENGVTDDRDFFVLEVDDKIEPYKSIPRILQEIQETRDPIKTESDIIAYIEGLDTNYNVRDISINTRQTDDIITANIFDTEQVFSLRLRAWSIDAPQWVQPTGAHDAYNAEDKYVTHNDKTWENTHGDGNSWEPGGDGIGDAIWKEVDPAIIRKIS